MFAARVVTRNRSLQPGQVPLYLRLALAFGLLSIAMATVGTVILAYTTYVDFDSEATSALSSTAFDLALVNNAPSTIASFAFVLAAGFLLISKKRREVDRSALAYLLVPCVWIGIASLTRLYAAGMIGAPVVVEVKALLEEEDTRSRGKAAAEAILDIPGLPEHTAIELRSALLKAMVEEGEAVEAFQLAAALATQSDDDAVVVQASKVLPKLMKQSAAGQSSEFCRFIYDKYVKAFPEAVRQSPFRFATDADWGWMRFRWDEEQLFESEKDNPLLHDLAAEFADHPDLPFVLYLLGDSETLEQRYADEPAGLLAAFRLARQRGGNSEAAKARFRRIVESDSEQSFVDDACLHYATMLAAEGNGRAALETLLTGYRRGNADQSTDIARLIIQTAAPMPATALHQLVSTSARSEPERERTPGLRRRPHVHARALVATVLANRLLSDAELDAGTATELREIGTILRRAIVSAHGTSYRILGRDDLVAVSDGLTRLASSLTTAGPDVGVAALLDSLESDIAAIHAITRSGSDLEKIDRLFARARQRAIAKLTDAYWQQACHAIGLDAEASVSSLVAGLEGHELARKVQDLDLLVHRFEEVARPAIGSATSRSLALLKRELPRIAASAEITRDFFVARRLDELRAEMGTDWILAADESRASGGPARIPDAAGRPVVAPGR